MTELETAVRAALPAALADLDVSCPDPASLATAPEDHTTRGVLWRARRGSLWFELPEVAHYLVQDGARLSCAAMPGVGPDEVARFAATTPVAAAYLQRGVPVLHAAAVEGPSGAVLLCGDSSAGKSVLLAQLLRRGHRMVADDLTALVVDRDGTVCALPHPAAVHLWPDARARLPDLGAQNVGTEPVPVSAVWVLAAANGEDLESHPLDGLHRFGALRNAAWNSRVADALVDRSAYLQVAGALAGSAVPMNVVVRPRGRWTGELVPDLVAADW